MSEFLWIPAGPAGGRANESAKTLKLSTCTTELVLYTTSMDTAWLELATAECAARKLPFASPCGGSDALSRAFAVDANLDSTSQMTPCIMKIKPRSRYALAQVAK